MERRAISVELRASEDGGKKITGYAAVFGSLSEPIGSFARGAFKEKILPTAFNACLAGNPDIRCTFNHSSDALLGRTKSGTLKLAVNNVGLRYDCQLPDTQMGNSVWESVRRGDVTGSSFGFEAEDDDWDDKGTTRTLRQVKVIDVGPVVWPAYSASTVSIRSLNGATETVKIGWYRTTGKLRVPLVGEKEMRAKSRQLRQELDGGDDDEPEDCTCECQSCAEDGDCSGCACEAGCDGTGCAAGECNCLERQASGRMRPAQGRTLYPADAGPLWREQFERDRTLEQQLFNSRQVMKLWRR